MADAPVEKKKNCWEVMGCERGPGGANVTEEGMCPAAWDTSVDKTNSGVNGGRCCWTITDTVCHGKAMGAFSDKIEECHECEFYKQVVREERGNFRPMKPGQWLKIKI